ncbi:MAG: Gfo/Idh/MocA family oxidoreductase [Nocardioidaceae bacterium]|nr:Gfo/Idh/MocA family oxidoreductase [Nocardioidaceae bacterium]
MGSDAKLRMGLVGAGPWAQMFHAPMIAGGPATTLSAVWARRPEAAATLVAAHGGAAVGSFDDLLERCDGVSFAVPPDVQAELAPRAAAAGKHLLLEKPLAFALVDAQRIVEQVEDAQVVSLLMLTNRFDPAVRSFLESARSATTHGSVASVISDAALPGGVFATPWRVERGALLDLGPHVLDLLDAAMGPVERITATGDPTKWVAVTTEHLGGAIGQAALSNTTPGAGGSLNFELFTDNGSVRFDCSEPVDLTLVRAAIVSEFAAAVADGVQHALGARRGLYLQELIGAAERSLRARTV